MSDFQQIDCSNPGACLEWLLRHKIDIIGAVWVEVRINHTKPLDGRVAVRINGIDILKISGVRILEQTIIESAITYDEHMFGPWPIWLERDN